jgi:osmoprotectant transport system ATP-binding protein
MATIGFQRVTKRYPGAARPAVEDVTFEVRAGAVCMLLGTSGSGKTTLLRMVNRLIEPTSGVITIDGHNVLVENPVLLRRRIGYVIQQVGLFPHMTVAENVRVTAEIAGWSRDRMAARVDELLRLVGLPPEEYRRRFPRQLSGGEQQRVGLARALATDPSILLMDEPFGALDAITRARMQEELVRIQRGVRKTILFVTHDVDEAFRLGDQIAVLSEGRLVQLGTPVELLTRPASDFVRQLVGADSVLRQLQYVPVTAALEAGAAPSKAPGVRRCPADTTLMQAMLRLIEGHTPLEVYDPADGRTLGSVTLSSLSREIAGASAAARGDGRGAR